MAYGWALLRAGQCDEAIVETGRALRMSSVDNFSGFYTSVHGMALLAARRFGAALPFRPSSVAGFRAYSGLYNSLIPLRGPRRETGRLGTAPPTPTSPRRPPHPHPH